MKNILILIFLNSLFGFSQNSELIILHKNDTLKSSEFDLLIATKNGFFKINNSNKILYEKYEFQNNEVKSISLIQENDTLYFFRKNNQKLTFEKDDTGYKSLSLSFNVNGKSKTNFDFELCKKSKTDIIINLVNNKFKKVYKELVIGIENPEGKYDEEFTSTYNIRKTKKKFRKRKKELNKYFKETEFLTISFGNTISIGETTKADNVNKK